MIFPKLKECGYFGLLPVAMALCAAGVSSASAFPDLSRPGLRLLSPLDGAWLDRGRIDFHGEAFSNWEVTPQLQDPRSGEWHDIADQLSAVSYDGFSANPARVDPGGTNWFNWHAEANWPYFDAGWVREIVTRSDGQRGAAIELRLVNRNNGTDTPTPYSHFGADASECIAYHEHNVPADSSPPTEVAKHCALSKDSITYNFKCGREGQACCAGDRAECDGGLKCSDHTCKKSMPPAPPPEQGVWWEALCECSNTFNYGYIGARCCALPSGGITGLALNAACGTSCNAINMELTSYRSLGPQAGLGNCNADAGAQCQIVPLQ